MNKGSIWWKWWFFLPISLVFYAVILGLIGFYVNANPTELAKFIWIIWVLSLLEWLHLRKK